MTPFLSSSSLRTRQIFFYLTVVCNLATCSRAFNATTIDQTLDDGARLVTDCRYAYPNYVTPYVISCSNVFVHEIPQLDNVTKMELVNVPLTVLNDTLIPLAIRSERVSLRQLHWTKSYITLVEKVPIPHLNELDLSWNVIREIRPNAVRQLVDLKKLNVSRNNITNLPSNLFDERNSVVVLSLAHNQLKTLPPTLFETLKRLEILDLSANQLSHLNEALFRRNTRLQNLDLAHNKLSHLPIKLFATLASLRYLSLEDNHLYVLEPDTFQTLHELMVLNLGKNPLWSLPSLLLPNNNTLFILTISHTRLRRVKLTALQNLRSLASLHLTDNGELQNLPADTFQGLRNLHTISLENNRFTQLPASLLDTKPGDLFLDGNPWPCDCSLQWIAYWVVYGVNGGRRSSLHLDTAKCNETDQDLMEALFQMRCPPNIVRVTPHSYQKLDSSVRLTCRAYANPPASVHWLTPNGQVTPPPPRSDDEDANESLLYPSEMVFVGENVVLYENGDLDIVRMSRDAAGEYTCVANNKLGESQALTRVYADSSIMERIKVGSIICGLLWVNTFIIFSVLYLLIRKYSKRTKREKRTERMQKNMDVYKSQQISRLRERCKNQMNRIKNNCSIQVDWMKENYKESISNSQQDHRMSCLTNQYNEQMAEIREYYLQQMHEVREHYNQQRNLILEFSVNRIGGGGDEEEAKAGQPVAPVDGETLARVENGVVGPATAAATTSSSSSAEEEEIYKYNDTMKNEIQMLTSLRNLHEIFAEATTTTAARRSRNGFHPAPGNYQTAPTIDTVLVSNGRVQRMPEDEGDESTSMLSSTR